MKPITVYDDNFLILKKKLINYCCNLNDNLNCYLWHYTYCELYALYYVSTRPNTYLHARSVYIVQLHVKYEHTRIVMRSIHVVHGVGWIVHHVVYIWSPSKHVLPSTEGWKLQIRRGMSTVVRNYSIETAW